MPILDIQQRFRELGRIRTGEQVPTSGGRTRPVKLARFRLTSEWSHLIEQAAAVFGGEPRPWDNAGKAQFEVTVEVDSLPVIIPPGEVLDQWYELWTGGGCQRRCDGIRQVLVDRPCACPADPMDRQAEAGKGKACKPTTRVRFMLPDVADVGIWRLESHGFHAAAELGGSVGLIEHASRSGAMIPADLRLASREGARRPGEQVKKFFVPSISFRGELGPVLEALGILDGSSTMPRMLGQGVEPRPPLDTGGRAALPSGGTSFDPAPLEPATFPGPPPAPPSPAPIADSNPGPAVVETPVAFEPPANADQHPAPPVTPPPAPEAFTPPPAPPAADHAGDDGPAFSGAQIVAMRFGARGMTDRAERLRFVSWIVAREITSGNDLTPQEVRSCLDVLNDDGSFEEVRAEVSKAPTSPESPSPAPPAPPTPPTTDEPIRAELVEPRTRGRRPAPAVTPDTMNADQWTTFLRDRGVKVTEVLREAAKLARDGDVAPPTTIAELAVHHLAAELVGFVEDLAATRGADR